MTPNRLAAPQQVLAAELSQAQALQTGKNAPLVVFTGPNGVDLAAAADELSVLGKWHPFGEQSYFKSINLMSSEARPDFRLTDLLPGGDAAPTVLLIKNVQHLHPAALPAFEATIRQLAGTKIICVCTLALPLPPETKAAFGGSFNRLRGEGLLRHVTLRPRPLRRTGVLIAETLGAQPEPRLVSRLWELTRGWPGAVVTALTIYHDNGMMSVVDRHAYLTGHCAPALSDNHELMLAIRRRGAQTWSIAKAIAVLSPLGEAAPRLIAEAVGITEAEVLERLTLLKDTGTLRYRTVESAWRFRIPLVATALNGQLGPFERRRLAQLAVSALWSGEAESTDPFYLADQLVAAGRMVDVERSRQELLANAERVAYTDGHRAMPWLRAAAELTVDRAERVDILLNHARTCMMHGRAELALESSDAVLRSYADELPGGQVVPVCFLHLTALHEARDLETLRKIADSGWWPWPGNALERTFARAFALSLLGRWQATHELIENLRCADEAGEAAGYIRYISPITNLWLGVVDEFDADITSLPPRVEAGQEPIGELSCHAGALLALGELQRAEELLANTRKLPVPLAPATQATKAFYEGKIDEGLELTRRHLATSSPNGCDAYQTVMIQLAASIQLLRGKVARSRDLLATARSRHPAMPHALAAPEAWYELLVQDAEQARSTLRTAVRQAEDSGIVTFTDALWANLADIEHTAGQTRQLPDYLYKVEKIAGQLCTETAEIRRLTLHALVHSDRGSADAALELARRRQQPLEQAIVMERLVRYGVADPELLTEVHSLLGDLGALLGRALTRLLMRDYGIAVPGRQATAVENERLLAVLTAEGLANRQIARALATSEKSVEGRLSRLFIRTGYKSRVELATAVLSGQFES